VLALRFDKHAAAGGAQPTEKFAGENLGRDWCEIVT
jgi:hypothetical protein